jgi:hypothetical protein
MATVDTEVDTVVMEVMGDTVVGCTEAKVCMEWDMAEAMGATADTEGLVLAMVQILLALLV